MDLGDGMDSQTDNKDTDDSLIDPLFERVWPGSEPMFFPIPQFISEHEKLDARIEDLYIELAELVAGHAFLTGNDAGIFKVVRREIRTGTPKKDSREEQDAALKMNERSVEFLQDLKEKFLVVHKGIDVPSYTRSAVEEAGVAAKKSHRKSRRKGKDLHILRDTHEAKSRSEKALPGGEFLHSPSGQEYPNKRNKPGSSKEGLGRRQDGKEGKLNAKGTRAI